MEAVKTIFLIHGRDSECADDVRHLLEAAGLEVWSFYNVESSLGRGAPFVGDVVQAGVERCDAVIALFTPDELAALNSSFRGENDEDSDRLRWQARPNVIFEAGLAFGINPHRTVLLTVGSNTKLFSDVKGRKIRTLDDRTESKTEFLDGLSQIGAKIAPKAAGEAVSTPLPAIARVVRAENRTVRDPFGHVGGDDWAFAGTAVVVDDSCRFLLVEHPHNKSLLPPGGRVVGNAKPDEVALAKTLVETGYEVELHPEVHQELALRGDRGVRIVARPFRVQYESAQREGIHHYDMLYVARQIRKISDGELESDWYTLKKLKEFDSSIIFPNVLDLLQSVHNLLCAER